MVDTKSKINFITAPRIGPFLLPFTLLYQREEHKESIQYVQ